MAVQLDPEWRSTTDETPDAALLQEEISGALHAALATLDSDDRSLLALRFEDARPVSEIAAILHLPTVFHVYRRLNAALGVLRRALARRGLESPDR